MIDVPAAGRVAPAETGDSQVMKRVLGSETAATTPNSLAESLTLRRHIQGSPEFETRPAYRLY